MMTKIQKSIFRTVACCLVTAMLLIMASPAGILAVRSDPAQKSFPSPEEARQALVSAVGAKDHAALLNLFGPVAREIEPGDPVEQAAEFEHFAGHVAEGVELVREGEEKAILLIGRKKWPFPVPIVKRGATWVFDTAAGREEIVSRRVGHNELFAIKVCRSYVDAQRDYYAMPEPDGDQIPKFAQHLLSSPGRRNGLYWPTAAGATESPLGPLVAKAREEGYLQPRKAGETGPRPFHGYYFRVLKSQGSSAPGGKFDYVIKGNMVAGFALVAYPARWGGSGVMTFIVNQRGRVYEKNLGPKTAVIARKMKAYNPDQSWKLASEP